VVCDGIVLLSQLLHGTSFLSRFSDGKYPVEDFLAFVLDEHIYNTTKDNNVNVAALGSFINLT